MMNPLLRWSGMLALGWLLGCDGAGARPIPGTGLESRSAPVIKAPEDVRIPGEYVVVFADAGADAAVTSSVDRVAHAGGDNQVLHRYGVIPGFAARLDEPMLERLRQTSGVAYIEENQRLRLNATAPSPADGIDRVDQRVGHDGLYDDHGRTGAGVHVYVLDTGINTQHGEFAGRIGAGASVINDGRGFEDCHGHGSHVSSTVAGSVHGLARQATLHPVRVLGCDGGGSWAGVIAGVDFVRADCARRSGSCVANLSLGGGMNAAVNQAIANAVGAGVTFVVAAGNEDTDACTRSPASEPKALTVAAIDDDDRRASFSNWGPCVDLFAPGVSIQGAWINGAQAVRSLDGTSMASPHVAGVAALYLEAHPGATPAQVEAGLQSSASIDCVADPKGSPDRLLFSDLQQGNYHCVAQPDSCLNRCGQSSGVCFCDPGCDIYGDCCADFTRVCQ